MLYALRARSRHCGNFGGGALVRFMASNRHLLVRVANADIAASARQFHWDSRVPVPFLCECDGDDCQTHVRLTLDQYDTLEHDHLYVTAPGHVIAAGLLVAVPGSFALYANVRLAVA